MITYLLPSIRCRGNGVAQSFAQVVVIKIVLILDQKQRQAPPEANSCSNDSARFSRWDFSPAPPGAE